MGVLVPVGGDLLTLREAEQVAKEAESAIDAVVQSDKAIGEGVRIRTLRKPISPKTLRRFRDDADPTKPYQKIGLNRPLTMVLEHAYLGELPDAAKWNPFVKKGDVLITSANRAFEKHVTRRERSTFLNRGRRHGPVCRSATGPLGHN